ncbi:MAG: sulfotransferase, partial [Leadbetterella sp.]|nr:sulfotransferase [Leadbetterella sp.]
KAWNRTKADLVEMIKARRFTLPPEISHANQISQGIASIQKNYFCTEKTFDQESPIFILSAGWRSGSTLLQRLLMSSREIVIWGEPLGCSGFIQKTAYSLSIITDQWPPKDYFAAENDLGNFANEWVANLTPAMDFFQRAHREMFYQWLGVSAKEQFGLSRWGLKEVRLTIDHAKYLKWLFPKARFIFLFRHPYQAFRSWKGNLWRDAWPGYYRNSPIAFGMHWRKLVGGFIEDYQEVGGMLVKFEDLISDNYDFGKLAHYAGLNKIDTEVVKNKIGSPVNKKKKVKKEISLYDRLVLRAICGSEMKSLGYLD